MPDVLSFLSDINYGAWANQSLLDASSTFPAEELVRDIRLSHNNIISTLRHIYDAERVWLDCLLTPDAQTYLLPQAPSPELSLEELKQSWPKLWDGYRECVQHETSERSAAFLSAEIIVLLPDSRPSLAREKILRHVLDHSQFHRGQVVAMIRALGRCPPAINRMDFFLKKDS
jgi:uncharacterized damage-inducible protein DinB